MLLARWARLAHRNQKHLRLDFFASSFAGSFVTGDGSCLGGRTAPATAAGELGVVSPSIWLSTRWNRPSCCRKSCSTLRASGAMGMALEGITRCGPATFHGSTTPDKSLGTSAPLTSLGRSSPRTSPGHVPRTSVALRSRGCCTGTAHVAGDQPGFGGCHPAAGGDDRARGKGQGPHARVAAGWEPAVRRGPLGISLPAFSRAPGISLWADFPGTLCAAVRGHPAGMPFRQLLPTTFTLRGCKWQGVGAGSVPNRRPTCGSVVCIRACGTARLNLLCQGTQGPFFLEEQTDKQPLTWWQGVLWDGSPSAAPPASSFLSSLKAWRCLCFSLGLDCAFSSVSPAHQSSFALNEDKHAKSLLGS